MRSGNSLDIINDHIAAKRFREARAMLSRELAGKSGDSELCSLMSFVLIRLAEFATAEYYTRRLATLMPDDARAKYNLGNLLLQLGKTREAMGVLARAIELDPGMAQAHAAMARGFAKTDLHCSARAHLLRAYELEPGNMNIAADLALSHHQCGEIERAVELMALAVQNEPRNIALCEGNALLLNYAPNVSARALGAEHMRFGDLLNHAIPATPRPALVAKRKLRIGVTSPDFRDHVVMRFFRPILEHADRGRVEFALYHSGTGSDSVTEWCRSKAAIFRCLPHESHADFAAKLRQDHLDVLFDLAGHTNMNRLAAMQMRLAPVQVTYLGYPNSSGLVTMDARLTDSLTDPAGSEEHYRERLIRIDPSMHCFGEPADAREVSPLPCERRGGVVTFGCFGALLKHNHSLYQLWSRVLERVAGSRLVIKHVGTRQEEVRTEVRGRLAAAGVNPERIDVRPPGDEQWSGYADIDIMLDTFPYHGTTTTCEALWMGVPVVVLVGDTTASRVGASLLAAAGVPEFVAHDAERYVEIAANLAADTGRLREYRATLRERVRASPLCDGPAMARRFVDAVSKLYQDIAAGKYGS